MKNKVIELLKELGYINNTKIMPINKSKNSHGNCCYCSDCRWPHDECVCDGNELIIELERIFEPEETELINSNLKMFSSLHEYVIAESKEEASIVMANMWGKNKIKKYEDALCFFEKTDWPNDDDYKAEGWEELDKNEKLSVPNSYDVTKDILWREATVKSWIEESKKGWFMTTRF